MLRVVLCALVLAAPAAAFACAPAGPLPAPYDALVEGEAAIAEGRFDDAIALLGAGGSLPVGAASRRRQQLLGEALLNQGDHVRATATLTSSLAAFAQAPRSQRGTPCDADPGALLWLLGDAARAQGDLAGAIAAWRALWTEQPQSDRSEDVEALLRAQDPAFGADEQPLVLARAAAFGSRNDHPAALALLAARIDRSQDGGRRTLVHASFRARQYRDAIALFDTLEAPLPQDRFDHALALSRVGDSVAAQTVYRGLLDAPGAVGDDASFKLGYLLHDGGDAAGTVTELTAHLERVPASRHAASARWFIAWSLFKLDRRDDARAAFGAVIEHHPASGLAAGAAYWIARLDGLEGRSVEERAGYEALLADHPETAYAWWAAGRLQARFPSIVIPETASDVVDPAVILARRLVEAGVPDWAAPILRERTARARSDGRAASVALAGQLTEVGLWAEGRALASPFCGTPSSPDPATIALCWPRPEADQVAAATTVARHLPFAIMRAESAWDPSVTSAAGARGLMQLMPALASAHAAATGGTLDPDALYRPDVNVSFGLAELAALTKSLGDLRAEPVLPLVIAAYNGGEAAVRRWVGEQPAPLDVDRWAEDVSYSETRRYVRRVLGTLQAYRLVYGD